MRSLVRHGILSLLLLTITNAQAADGGSRLEGVWFRSYGGPVAHSGDTNIGATRPIPGPPPQTVEIPFQPWAKEVFDRSVADVRAGRPLISSRLLCLPEGPVDMMLTPYGFQFLTLPNKVYIFAEWGNQVRHVHMNAQHPRTVPLTPNGHSVGRWDGDALVVDTIGISDAASLMTQGGKVMHSDALHLVERFSVSADGKTLTNEITIEDPKAFTAPWTIRLMLRRDDETKVFEFVCADAPLDLNG